MNNFTTNTYEMKRYILNFSKKICNGVSKPESKKEKYFVPRKFDILFSICEILSFLFDTNVFVK